MIAIRDSLRAKGCVRLANVVHSLITKVLSKRFSSYPKVDSCVRYMAGFIDRNKPLTKDAIRLMHILGATAPFVSFDHDGVVKLILYLDTVSVDKPEILDHIERRL